MSQIDQAFIQAYATPHSRVGPVPTPHFVLPEATLDSQHTFAAPITPEPIPAPHFQTAGVFDPYRETMSPEARATEVLSIDAMPAEAAFAETIPIETVTMPLATIAKSATTLERRPLSTFSAPDQPATATFNPVFEVDAFRWPALIEDLLRDHSKILAPVAEQLLAAREAGRTMVGIAGTRPGVGCTTVLLCLSRMLVQADLQVAIVDANFSRGDLAAQLGLEFDTGWEDALTGKVPLAETIVKSLHDRLAILPLTGPSTEAGELLAGIQTSISAGVLRYHYDIVLFDLGSAAELPQHDAAQKIMEHSRIDASLIVADAATDSSTEANIPSESINGLLEIFGSTCHGLVGNHAV